MAAEEQPADVEIGLSAVHIGGVGSDDKAGYVDGSPRKSRAQKYWSKLRAIHRVNLLNSVLHKERVDAPLYTIAFKIVKGVLAKSTENKTPQRLVGILLYALVGCLGYNQLEGWGPGTTLYFLCTTASTVGFGDVSPTTKGGKLFSCVWALWGITQVFMSLSLWARTILHYSDKFQRFLLAKIGIKEVDVTKIGLHVSPAEVNKQLNYPKRIFLATLPCIIVILIGVAIGLWVLDYDLVDAIYWTFITSTTIGYGDLGMHSSALARTVISIFVLVAVTAITDAIMQVSFILTRRAIRKMSYTRAMEDMVMHNEIMYTTKVGSTAPVESCGVSEADFLIAALVHHKLVDQQVMIALRRQYHYMDSFDNNSGCITAEDVFGLKQREGNLKPYEPPTTDKVRSPRPIDTSAEDGGFSDWLERYWKPRKGNLMNGMALKQSSRRASSTKEYVARSASKMNIDVGHDELSDLATNTAVISAWDWVHQHKIQFLLKRAKRRMQSGVRGDLEYGDTPGEKIADVFSSAANAVIPIKPGERKWFQGDIGEDEKQRRSEDSLGAKERKLNNAKVFPAEPAPSSQAPPAPLTSDMAPADETCTPQRVDTGLRSLSQESLQGYTLDPFKMEEQNGQIPSLESGLRNQPMIAGGFIR